MSQDFAWAFCLAHAATWEAYRVHIRKLDGDVAYKKQFPNTPEYAAFVKAQAAEKEAWKAWEDSCRPSN